jgi:hypothetical protein
MSLEHRWVIWAGARPRPELASPTNRYVSHALDCRWVAGIEEKTGNELPRVLGGAVPAEVRPCGHCGGPW